MNKENLKLATPIGKSYRLSEWESLKELIDTLDSGMYGCKNEDGEDVLVLREVGAGLEVMTFQNNGWTRVNYYTEKGHDDGETFKGRWNK